MSAQPLEEGRRDATRALAIALLSVFLGFIGIDRFVNGNILAGVLKLLTVGGAGIWWLVDVVIFGWRAYLSWRATQRTDDYRPDATPARSVAAAGQRRGHVPPSPRGAAVSPWVPTTRHVDVVGEYYRLESYDKILATEPRTGQTVRLEKTAALYPDPHNPHSSGTAVAVWIDGLHAGFLPAELSSRYSTALREMAEKSGTYLEVPARVAAWYQTRNRRWDVQTSIGLPEPEDLRPHNAMPVGDCEIVPTGRVIQVTKENEHMDVLGPLTTPGHAVPLAATLRPAWSGARGTVRTVEVMIDGEAVGEFSSQTGSQTVDLVELILDAGRIPVVRATLEGNNLGAELKVRMQRTAEFDHSRVEQLRELARVRRANTTHRGEEFDWND
ncbi:TM2 domain-containing protein [Brachybacterium sp. GCM10030268]|uniref:TM2 domain-containing protein n=1 Tax=Brachybacterium sp. GCM10030268 TaxID=3273382 RepID=UPI00361368F4